MRCKPGLRLVCAHVLVAALLAGCMHESFPLFGKSSETETAMEAEAPAPEEAGAAAEKNTPLTNEIVSSVQQRLSELGYEPGPVDGLIGPKTRGAIRRFQTDAGIAADGRITDALLERLEINEATEATEAPTQQAPMEQAEYTPPDLGPPSPLGPPPSYRLGSRFVYSDGSIETVTAVDGPMARWTSNRGGTFVSYHNFLVSPISWQTAGHRGQRLSTPSAARLWSIAGRPKVDFTVMAYSQYGDRPDNRVQRREIWNCESGETEEVEIRAGRFEARKIACEVQIGDSPVAAQRTWYYAPQIRHFITWEESWSSRLPEVQVELLAIQPGTQNWPPVVRAGLQKAFQHALENGVAGVDTPWASSALETEVRIRPGPTVKETTGRVCRSYLQIWNEQGVERVYPGLACRSNRGNWLIPGLEHDTFVAEQIE